MKRWVCTMALAVALAGCGSAPETPPEPTAAASEAVVEGPQRRVLAFGDSLFAGYRLQDGESYPARLQAALRARGINAVVTNAGVSGDTSAAGLQRLEFVLDGLEEAPDLAIVELGGNDLLRGISPLETRHNLSLILGELRDRNIPVLLMGMRAPPNLGEAYVAEFDGIYADLAQSSGAALVPFFMAPLVGKPNLVQDDRIHPTAQGIDAMVAASVDAVAGALPKD